MTRLQETTTTAIIKSVTYVSGSNCHLCPRSHTKRGRGKPDFYTSRPNNISTNGQCGGSNEDGKYQQNTTSKPITQAGDERYGNEGEADR